MVLQGQGIKEETHDLKGVPLDWIDWMISNFNQEI